MAITVVQHTAVRDGTASATVAVAVSATGSGNLIVVITQNDGGHHVSGVSDGTTAFTQFASAAVDGTGPMASQNLDCWYLLSSNSGKTTMTATFDASASYNKDAWVWEVSGLTSPSTDGHNSIANGTAVGVVQTGAAVTTTSTSGFLAALDTPGNDIALNPNTGNEFASGGDNLNGNGGVSLISSTAASHTPEWTSTTTSDPFVSLTVAFKGTVVAVFVPRQTYMVTVLTQ